jgi:hypothetical protein
VAAQTCGDGPGVVILEELFPHGWVAARPVDGDGGVCRAAPAQCRLLHRGRCGGIVRSGPIGVLSVVDGIHDVGSVDGHAR